MATNITVTLSDEQVATALESARLIFPDATNADLKDKLEESSLYGPGIRVTIGQWQLQALRQSETEARQEATDNFNVVFPPKPVESDGESV